MEISTFDTIVIGSGAAGFNTACSIKKLSSKTVAIVTEGRNMGTSRNTGSDKQTYYKLSLAGDTPDSVRKMAQDLFNGGAVDGDNALCEAALSAKCFFNLCSLGVPFPANRYGEYTGYKTDHDPYMRATSAGPLTSKYMTEALEKEAKALGVPVFDNLLAVEILKTDGKLSGLLCIDKTTATIKIFRCNNIVLATGGPAGIYYDSVYPESQTGATALALEAGASLQNMTEWQYGLASKYPRWNVSGTYMQVLPRFVSVDRNGKEYEFLNKYSDNIYETLSDIFLKGYQWPFDSKKSKNGSSRIDLAVYNECIKKKRKVFLDYTKNPFGLTEIDFSRLSNEAYTYLKNADALSCTPIERLRKMNSPAIELYKSKGVDLSKDYLEISLSAQHCNGGIAVDMWWQTAVPGLFAAGECAGTHGITRPGGSALNAGQAGALRIAQYISVKAENYTDEERFSETAKEAFFRHTDFINTVTTEKNTATKLLESARKQMSSVAAAVRDIKEIPKLITENNKALEEFMKIKIDYIPALVDAYKYRDTLLIQNAVLHSILDYSKKTDKNRGSAIYINNTDVADNESDMRDMIQEIKYSCGRYTINWRKCRPIPENNDFFENVWKSYRENKNIY